MIPLFHHTSTSLRPIGALYPLPSLPNHRAPAPPADFIPIKSRPSTSLPHPNQQSFWFHPSLLTKSAMHQKVNQVPIILKFHPDLIKMIGF
jgi:hypothetical protein